MALGKCLFNINIYNECRCLCNVFDQFCLNANILLLLYMLVKKREAHDLFNFSTKVSFKTSR